MLASEEEVEGEVAVVADQFDEEAPKEVTVDRKVSKELIDL